ncbi:MAG: methionine ABC transporter permease [Xenophilus sp.]
MITAWNEVPELLLPALGQTLLMVGCVMLLVVLFGTITGIVLHNTSPLGLFPRRHVHNLISAAANIGRSLPFLVLMAAIIPFTRWLVGTNIGIAAAIVPMTLAGTPFFARLVQNALREVPREAVAVGIVSGGHPLQIIFSIQLHEAIPALIAGFTINLIAMIEYSAIAGAIGAGGLGYLAINYGYQRFDANIMLACVVTLIALTQVIQFAGDIAVVRLSR